MPSVWMRTSVRPISKTRAMEMRRCGQRSRICSHNRSTIPSSLHPAVERRTATAPEGLGESIGPYKLVEEIGRGGMGVVYRAQQEKPVKRQVAVKVIKAGMDTDEVVARFEAEREALALMDHPNIARILDAGASDSGRPFVVMELVEGVPISEFCQRHVLPINGRLQLFIKICGAVQHAHQKGVIHRDLKPSNILVMMFEGVPFPKIIDFGVAKATEGKLTNHTQLTQLHLFVGTPAYLSPEQAEVGASTVDTRTDIYALGILLYELLTGAPPFDPNRLQREGHEAMRRIIREETPLRPSVRITTFDGDATPAHSGLGKDLDWIVLKALEKDREHRYDTASGLALDVERYLNDEPVSAAAPSHLYAIAKFVRRNRAVSLAATVAVAALTLGLGFALLANQREREARRLAEDRRYASDMKVALHAVDSQRHRLRPLLDQQLPVGDSPDRRGWLWRYLDGQSRQELRRIDPGNVGPIAVSHDGKWIAHRRTAAGESLIEVRDSTDFTLVQTRSLARRPPTSLRFSADDSALILSPRNGTPATQCSLKDDSHVELSAPGPGLFPRLCQTEAGDAHLLSLEHLPDQGPQHYSVTCRPAFPRNSEPVVSDPIELPVPGGTENEFQVAPDGSRVALACIDAETGLPIVRVYRIPDLAEITTMPLDGLVSALTWSPDSQSLALGYYYPTGSMSGRYLETESLPLSFRFRAANRPRRTPVSPVMEACWRPRK